MTEAIGDEPLGDHVLELQIAEVVDETDEARSLVFAVPDGSDDPEIPPRRLRYAPGQFLTLRVPSERTGSVARCYSLCSSPYTDDALAVTVKRTADGYASNWLCDHAQVGMRIHVLAPSGNFVPTTLDATSSTAVNRVRTAPRSPWPRAATAPPPEHRRSGCRPSMDPPGRAGKQSAVP